MSTPSPGRTRSADPCADEDLKCALDVFLGERKRLFSIAYRVVGDVYTAQDVVQEAWLRWQRTERARITNPSAFLATTTARLAINVVQSARHRHEALREYPVADFVDTAQNPTLPAEQTVTVECTLHHLMSKLTSAELAAYVLRKGFDYAYDDLASMLGTTVVNTRQLVRRAQLRLESDVSQAVSVDSHRRLVSAFLAAVRGDGLDALDGLFSPGGLLHASLRQAERTRRLREIRAA
jgi:DNA-directed RNA polymerase specialized sigma24 family protein